MLSTCSVERSATPESLILEVALDTPLRQVFDYLPVLGEPRPEPGMRVLVPFGRRQLVGVIVSLKDRSERDTAQLKRVVRAIDPAPTFDPPLLKLLRWAADYYHHPLGEALATALPSITSPWIKVTFLCLSKPAGCSAFRRRVSKTTTSLCSASTHVKCVPIKPAPPVSRTLFPRSMGGILS